MREIGRASERPRVRTSGRGAADGPAPGASAYVTKSRDADDLVGTIASEVGDEVLVTYEATKTDGRRFRNTEILGFEDGKISRMEVYFGWNLP
jgi:hypothetical protein